MATAPQRLAIGTAAASADSKRLPLFARAANWVARVTGKPATFLFCCLIIIVWGVSGPIYHYSDTWQLVINTGTTIITFLMVFLIQNTQNREGAALQAKLDELIRATKDARNDLVDAEELPEETLVKIKREVDAAAGCDTGNPQR
jgi:low affinity Fe/Cu permease